MVMNAALGFDTYMVVRHGLKLPKEGASSSDSSDASNMAAAAAASSSDGGDSTAGRPSLRCIPGDMLGCYFCNDVVAPGDVSIDFIAV